MGSSIPGTAKCPPSRLRVSSTKVRYLKTNKSPRLAAAAARSGRRQEAPARRRRSTQSPNP